MNTAMISPALEIATSKPTPSPTNKQSDAGDNNSASFSDVLSKQHAANEQTRTDQPVKPGAEKKNNTTAKENTAAQGNGATDTETLAEDASQELLKLATEAGVAALPVSLLHTTDKTANAGNHAAINTRLTRASAITPEHHQRGMQLLSEQKTTDQTLRFSSVAIPTDKSTEKPVLSAALNQTDINTEKAANALADKPNLHQSANFDASKAKPTGNTKAVLAAMVTDSSKANPGAGKVTVNEFSSAMIDAATLAQSRFADHRQSDTGMNSNLSAEHAIAQVTLGTGSAIASNGSLAAIPGTPTPLSSPQWATDFGRQFVNIAQNSTNGTQIAELRLDPPELGPLRITINLSDNVAHAAFTSPHAMVRQTVENALPQLQQLLAQAGISLGDTSVSDQGQTDQSHDGSGNNKQQNNSNGVTSDSVLASHTSDTASITRTPSPDALVDTFA